MTEGSSPPELARALDAARAALGSPEQVARLRERVASGVAAGVPGIALQRTPHAKWGGWTLAGLIAAGGSWLWLQGAAPQASPLSTHAPAVVQPVAPPRVPEEPQPTAAPAPSDPVATQPPAGRPGHVRARRPAGSPPSAAEAVAQPSEVELISRAEDLIDRTPAAALELLGTHERLYPHGMLGEERDVLRVDAEWALGQRGAALGHARAFVQRYPRSAQTRRLTRLLADHNFEPAATPTE